MEVLVLVSTGLKMCGTITIMRKPSTTILFISAGLFHPSTAARRSAAFLLKGYAVRRGYLFERSSALHLESLNTVNPELAVLYFHRKAVNRKALENLSEYLQNGGKVLYLHSISASWKASLQVKELVGGVFSSHGDVAPITMESMNLESCKTGQFTITDELYRHETEEGLQIVLQSKGDGSSLPLAWIKGKTANIACGHLKSVWTVPEIQGLVFSVADRLLKEH